MLTPKEVSNKTFDKTFGIGYRVDDVEAYLQQVASSMTELLEINADLEKKLEVLAEKLGEYREDEESLRTAILGAQKLGDSVIRESKTKAEIIIRDATCKSEAMVYNAKRQIEREQENLIRTQKEVATFKNRLLDMYKQHIELISMLPGEVDEQELEEAAAFAPEAETEEAAPQPEEVTEVIEEAEEITEEAEQEIEQVEEDKLPTPDSYFGIDLDDDDDDEEDPEENDDEKITGSYTAPESSKHGEMRFGEAFKIKHKSNHSKFRK